MENRPDNKGDLQPWTIELLHEALDGDGTSTTKRTVERSVLSQSLLPPALSLDELADELGRPVKKYASEQLARIARHERTVSLFVQLHTTPSGKTLIAANDGRNARRWVFVGSADPDDGDLLAALRTLCGETANRTLLWPHGDLCRRFRKMADSDQMITPDLATAFAAYQPAYEAPVGKHDSTTVRSPAQGLSHLDRLEAECIHIMREVAATADNPVMLYSVGKDSSVMLHLAIKAFYPAPPPFPLLHVDTGWKFQEMYQFRDRMAVEAGMKLITHLNPDGVAKNINPIDHGSSVHTDIMKTQGLKQALNEGKYDVAFGGARRDEEKSRAKERIFSFRSETHRWDPKNQRPELWSLYNTAIKKGESIRAFPISNWTELDVWQYIHREQIPIVPLYFAAIRPFVQRDGMLIMLDDDRLQPLEGEEIHFSKIRFRTLGCYPLTGGFESDADDLDSVILELLQARNSERQGRAIDSDASASMEKKKQEGYF
ncbi:MAG: sulfate adenylyltransferase subunit CysD [Hyphomicrobiales bacterium]|nr:sulfate adenylyltransferase subunit CysD [Hyphomicrobiales bacterium]MCP4998047.1 sulfate adenylyltransferase subunit CysD [Hyphomicrobiales bacterium]